VGHHFGYNIKVVPCEKCIIWKKLTFLSEALATLRKKANDPLRVMTSRSKTSKLDSIVFNLWPTGNFVKLPGKFAFFQALTLVATLVTAG